MRTSKTIGRGDVSLVEGIDAKAQDKDNNKLDQTRLHPAQLLSKSPATDTGNQVYEEFALTAERHMLVPAYGRKEDNRGFGDVSQPARGILKTTAVNIAIELYV